MAPEAFLVDVPNGQYELTLAMGDQTAPHDLMGANLRKTARQGRRLAVATAGQFSTTTYTWST